MMLVVMGLVALAVAAVVVASLVLMDPREQSVKARLRGYSADEVHEPTGLRAQQQAHLAESQLLQDVAEATGRVADRVGILERIEGMLERAALPVRASEVLFLYLIGVAVVFVAAFLLLGDIFLVLLLTLVTAFVPYIVLRRRASKRIKTFSAQLPDLLQLLSGALRAGFSFMQALESVAQETTEPARKELTRVVSEASLGRPPEEALADVAVRMQSEDLRWAVMAVSIQREVGGNLAEVLDTVSHTMVERERLRREIKALTAEGRASAVVLGSFPFVFGLILFTIQPTFIETLFETRIGQIALIGAVMLSGLGFLWLNKIMKIEV